MNRTQRSGAVLLFLLLSGAFSPPAEGAPGRLRQASVKTLVRHFAAIPYAVDELGTGDQVFLAAAVQGGRGGMRLAELGLKQATRGDVRTVALQAAAELRQLIQELETLARSKGALTGPLPGNDDDFHQLVGQSGDAFDRGLVLLMSGRTQDLLALFEHAASAARDADVRELAGNQLPLLREHRNKLLELRRDFE